MIHWPLWAVLAPADLAWMKRRAFAALEREEDEEDEDGPSIETCPGSDRYHALVGEDPIDIGVEIEIAKALSLECDGPVYSIERANDPWTVMSWRNGTPDVEEVDPDDLAESLGCPLPGREWLLDSPARKPLRNAALLEGVRADEVPRVLEEAEDPAPPAHCRFEDTPLGLRISSEKGDIGIADITLSEHLPHVTAYSVIASPSLDMFFVHVLRGGACIGRFALPPMDDGAVPELEDIKGERSPERILAALGIPAEWFRDE
jgi:hypothetical protein